MPDFSAIHRSLASAMHRFGRVGSSTIALPILLYTPYAQAEGSRDLISNNGYRPYLEYSNLSAGAILRRSIIKVYVEPGETLELASSAVGINNGVINYRRPNGTSGTCDTAGLISSRSQEINRTYIPCTVAINNGEGGIWEINFVSPDEQASPGTNPTARTVRSNWDQPSNAPYVSAWDITVVDSSGNDRNGRVYANYFAFNMGRNNIALNSEFTVLTEEGYQYSLDLNGLDPFGFILFSNNSGYRGPDGQPIFRSLQYAGNNPGNVPSGFRFQNPNLPDTSEDTTHKLFINPPDSSMPGFSNSPTGNTWLYSLPESPPLPQNFKFTGIEGTEGQAGTNPLGGNFTFDSSSESSYSITLDLDGDGIFGNGIDRTFLGRSEIGSNSLLWDGLDGNGNSVAASDTGYGAQINFYAGEAHFPMVDAENNPNGIKLTRLNSPPLVTSPLPDPSEVFYDDRISASPGTDYSLCASNESGGANGCYGTSPTPRSALTGVNSNNGAHRFSSEFGDTRGIDTWVYYPSNQVTLDSAIRIREADLVLLKTDNVDTVAPGAPLTYIVTIENKGPSDIAQATFVDNLPPELTNATWSCAITSGNGSCDEETGTADSNNQISTTLDLEQGAIATYTITTQVSATAASGSITNTGTVRRPNDVTDPDETNNSDSDSTTILEAIGQPNVLLVKRITAINGQPISLNGDNLSSYIDEITNPYDDNNQEIPGPPTSGGPQPDTANWPTPSSFLIGGIDGGKVRPGDELEYTIYFLSSGELEANEVLFCDRVPENIIFNPSAFNSGFPADSNGIANSDHGILLNHNGTSQSLSNLADGDRGYYFPPNSSLTALYPQLSDCGNNDNGAIVVDLQTLPSATAPGTPIGASGFVRFRGQVK